MEYSARSASATKRIRSFMGSVSVPGMFPPGEHPLRCYPCSRSNLLPMYPVCTLAFARRGPLTANVSRSKERQAMAGDLVEAGPDDRRVIAALLDEYLQELVAHREIAVGATDSRSYPYLDAYFVEPGRHAFLIRCNGEVVGLALIRAPASSGSPVSEVAEFYVKPGSRRLGLGREVIGSIWRRFPGAWELQVHARNAAALGFWTSCVEASAEEPPDVREIEAEDGKRIQFNFYVRVPHDEPDAGFALLSRRRLS